MSPAPRRSSTVQAQGYVDSEQPALLRSLRRCSLQSDYTRWDALRGELSGMGYRVVVVKGVEHLRPLAGS
jgi:hypothetical protein